MQACRSRLQPRAPQAATPRTAGCAVCGPPRGPQPRTAHTGAMLYMMPLGRGVSKPKANWAGFGEPDTAFWCCYGTGVESFAKLNDNVYFEASAPAPPAPPAPPLKWRPRCVWL